MEHRAGGLARRRIRCLTCWTRTATASFSATEIEGVVDAIKTLDRNGDGAVSANELRSSAGRTNPQPSRGGSRPGSGGSSRLASAGLKIGAAIPHVTALDAAGAEFPLADLKGSYHVLVFGCLT